MLPARLRLSVVQNLVNPACLARSTSLKEVYEDEEICASTVGKSSPETKSILACGTPVVQDGAEDHC